MPRPGMTLALDNALVRIASVSGGRILVDFNNPLSGKEIVYEFTIKRKIDDLKEKINFLMDYFFKKRIEFTIEEKKVVFSESKIFEPIIEMLNKEFKDVLELELLLKVKDEEKDE